MEIEDVYIMISRKLTGELDHFQEQRFENWIQKSDQNKELYKELKSIWEVNSDYQKKSQGEKLFNEILTRIEVDESVETIPKHFRISWISIAASIILIIVFLAFFQNHDVTNPSVLDEVVFIEKSNPKGQKSVIHLPDGSSVVLNAGSSLRYPEKFGEHFRRLEMSGEAFFEIVKDKDRPFVITSGEVVTEVLGTSFNLRSFPEEDLIDVALVEGSLKVSNTLDKSQCLLKPGEVVRYDQQGKLALLASGSIHKYTSWKDGILYFENASMEDVISKLERWYNVEFFIEGKPDSNWNYSAQFNGGYLNHILESISFSQDFEYDIEEREVYLKF